jgi:hypothetical protein
MEKNTPRTVIRKRRNEENRAETQRRGVFKNQMPDFKKKISKSAIVSRTDQRRSELSAIR